MAFVTPLLLVQPRFAIQYPEVKKPVNRPTKIKLTSTLQPVSWLDGAKILAMIKNRRKRWRLRRQMERLQNEKALPNTFFRPLEKYLIKIIRENSQTPNLPLSELMSFLEYSQMPANTSTTSTTTPTCMP